LFQFVFPIRRIPFQRNPSDWKGIPSGQIVDSQSIDSPRNHLELSGTIWNYLKQEEKSC
jgi:hypothetical protein